MKRPLISLVSVALITLGACAEASAPLPPAEEVLLAVNSTAPALSVVPVENPGAAITIPLGPTATPVGVSAREGYALVPLGLDNAVAVVNLKTGTVDRTIPLANNSGATGSAIIDDSIGYVANPNINTVTRVNYLTGDTSSVAVGVYPQQIVYTRGKVFVLNGNLVNFAVAGESWITVIDPDTRGKASGIDSIGLPGPGNAGFAQVGSDGLMYVLNIGGFNLGDLGRISRVDPVAREEQGNFGGFGNAPSGIAIGGNLLYISSYAEGLMVFDTETSDVVKGAGDGVAIPLNATVAVDSKGRIYAFETGPCNGTTSGKAHVLRSDLTETGTITLGDCPVGGLVTTIPAE